jgi:polyketide cyclase/dehydrase/lipid transport protein
VGSKYDVSYSGSFDFDDVSPEELWTALSRVDLFHTWWPWIKDIHLEGEALELGSALTFTIDPPIPYKLRVTVDVVESDEDSYLRGDVSGDLHGTGSLRFEEFSGGSEVTTDWNVVVSNPAIKAVIFLARPLLLYAQRWAVEVSLRGFRRYLAERESLAGDE